MWDEVAASFEATAESIALVRASMAAPAHQDIFERSLELLAEAQSSLRSAIGLVGAPGDTDQAGIFNWLRATASNEQIFIRRFMKVDDSADPANSADLLARIDGLAVKLQALLTADKQRAGKLGRVRYHIKTIQDGRGTDHDWATVADTIHEMVLDGLPPSNVELRDILLPVIANMPELSDVPEGFRRVSSELDRYLASRPTDLPTMSAATPSPEVLAVKKLLKGRAILLIGGDSRMAAKEALEAAFGLSELIWVATKDHQSTSTFEPFVARTEVAVVILAIRWASHSYGNVKAMCDRQGKAFVRLPGGYSPNQVAHQILEQVGNRLSSLPAITSDGPAPEDAPSIASKNE